MNLGDIVLWGYFAGIFVNALVFYRISYTFYRYRYSNFDFLECLFIIFGGIGWPLAWSWFFLNTLVPNNRWRWFWAYPRHLILIALGKERSIKWLIDNDFYSGGMRRGEFRREKEGTLSGSSRGSIFANIAGVEIVGNVPDRWYDNTRWRCQNGHVSPWHIKSEAQGRDTCTSCGEQALMSFPEDHEGNLLGQEIFALRMRAWEQQPVAQRIRHQKRH